MSGASPEVRPEVWEDMTDVFKSTAQGMRTGQMIHGERFCLREAMSALELMDPKMDAGMNTSTIYTLDVAMAEGKLPCELSIPQILAVIDELVACEANWHSGDSAIHTLYTCLYLHDPDILKAPILRTYVRCLLKTCDIVRAVILDANIFEEEDFSANKFSFDLGENLDEDTVLHDIRKVEQELELQLRQANGKAKVEVQPLQEDETLEKTYCEALLCRIRFRKAFFQINTNLARNKAALQGLRSSEKAIHGALQQLAKVRTSLELAHPAPGENSTYATCGFEKSVIRLIANAPPKNIKIMERSSALDFMKVFLTTIQRFYSLCEADTLEKLMQEFKCFSATETTILPRSIFVRLLHSEDDFAGKGPLVTLIENSHHRFCGSSVACTKTEDFEVHVARMARPVYLIFRLYCENHTRQRRRVCKLLADWTILQQDATHLDANAVQQWEQEGVNLSGPQAPYKYPFVSWVFDITTQLLAQYFLLSLELDLYTPRELPVAFWYLDYLLEVRLRNYTLAWRPLPVADTAKGKKGKHQRKKKPPKVKARGPAPRSWEFQFVEAMMHMCKGNVMTIFAAQRAGVDVPFINSEYFPSWYANRFLVDMSKVMQPGVLTLDQYQQMSNYYKKLAAPELCKQALAAFEAAKVLAGKALSHNNAPPSDMCTAIKGFQRVAVTNAVGFMVISKGVSDDPAKKLSGKKISFEFTHHKCFPAISIK